MIINHNLNAMNAHRMMNSNISAAGKSMEKLSSGLRINRAGDDAAGLAISEKMRGQIRGLDQASRNSQDGISMIQTAEGALNEEHSILQRMKELATQAANGTNTKEDTSSIQQEINQLTSEINKIGNTTEFNKQKVLQGGDVDTSKLGTVVAAAGSKATPASAAKVTVADVSGLYKSKMSTALSGSPKIVLNEKDIDLTNTKALDGTSTDLTTDQIMDAIQKDINVEYDGTKNDGVTFKLTKTDDGKGFTIESSVKGSKSTVNITANADSATLKLTKDASTDTKAAGVDEVKDSSSKPATTSKSQFKTVLQIGANEGQAFSITIGDMRAEALGISQKITAHSASAASSSSKETPASSAKVTVADVSGLYKSKMSTALSGSPKIVLNEKDIDLTNTKALDGTSTDLTTDQIMDAIQKDINVEYDGTKNDGITFKLTKTDDGKGFTIESSVKGSKSTVNITANADSATLKLTKDASTDTKAAGVDEVKGSSSLTPASATSSQKAGNSGNIGITDGTKYTGTADATWKVTYDGANYNLDKGDGKSIKLTLTGNKATVDGLELDMSKISSPVKTDKWEISVTSAKAVTVATTLTAAKASAVKIGDNSFTIDAGKGNGADGNIAIEIKQSANAGEDSTAVFSNDGKTLTLTLDKGKTFTSDDIQKLISTANNDDNKPTYLDMTKFTVKADDAANDSIDASKLSGTTTTSLSGGASLPTFTSSKKAEVTNGIDDVVVEAGLDVSDHDHATHAISVLDRAIAMVSTERGKLGAMQNRLEHTINNLNTSSENLSAAESRIRDTDMANEMMTYSKNNILSQASQAMIAQAKSQPEQVLQLLR